MTKEEALATFIQEELKAASGEFLDGTMPFLAKGRKQDTARQFARSVADAVGQAPGLGFLQLVLLRSRALAGLPFYRFEAYGEDFYLSEPLATVPAEMDWLYQAYCLFLSRLDEGSRKYLGKVGREELDRIKLAQLWTCRKIVQHLFAESFPYLMQNAEYRRLDAAKKVQFHLGDYRGEYEVLLTKDELAEKMGGVLCGVLLDQGV